MAEGPIDAAIEAARRQELPQPVPSALAAKADDLEAIRSAVVDAAGAAVGIWLSYLLALFYLPIAAAGVTHRDLFLGNPVKLPFLNVDLPLKGFFWFGPALFVILHVYVLLHFVLLAGKVGVFDTALRTQIHDPKVRERLRRQLPSNIFVQLLAGPHEVREGLIGLLLRLIAWITVLIGPIALLVLFQLQFLPYHDESITLWQRIAVVIDLGLLWTLWPSVARGEAIGAAWRGMKRTTIALMTITSLALVALVFMIVTFPGENLDQLADIGFTKPLHDFLVAGDVDLVDRKPRSIWSNRIVLPQFDVIDHSKFDTESKIAAMPVGVSLRARNLRGAVLIGASLRSVDFAGADLRDARLERADLKLVDFTGADLRDARLESADLRGAKLACEQTSLNDQPLSEQSCVRLQNATLDRANMQGVALRGAQLQGASLQVAQLQGASLIRAQLLGASLMDASLRGATLLGAGFEGAKLFGVDLQGAFLYGANFQGADLQKADLRAASLGAAQLQGAFFQGANLNSAFLWGAFVWRADTRPDRFKAASIKVEGTSIANLETAPKFVCQDSRRVMSAVCDWSKQAYEDLKRRVTEQISSESRRQEAMSRIERLNPTKPLESESELAQRWVALTGSSPSKSTYQRGLTKELTRIGCEPAGAPYVLDAIIHYMSSPYGQFEDQDREALHTLAVAFIDKEHCPGARKLSEYAEATLKELLMTPGKPERVRVPHR
jgi:uncharacterized protein YjbI with pentapeptide repeats